MTRVELGLITAIVLVLIGAAVGVWYDVAHPCTHKVNCRTIYVVVGSIATPVESCDCVERAP